MGRLIGKGNKQARSVPLVKLEFYDAKQPYRLIVYVVDCPQYRRDTYRLTLSIAVARRISLFCSIVRDLQKFPFAKLTAEPPTMGHKISIRNVEIKKRRKAT